MQHQRNGNGVTYKYILGMILSVGLVLGGALLGRGLDDLQCDIRDNRAKIEENAHRLSTLELLDARRDEQVKQIQRSLYRLEQKFGTLPDSIDTGGHR